MGDNRGIIGSQVGPDTCSEECGHISLQILFNLMQMHKMFLKTLCVPKTATLVTALNVLCDAEAVTVMMFQSFTAVCY